MKDKSRAIRRHHIQRLKKKRKGYTNAIWYGWTGSKKSEARRLGRIVHTATLCSCHVCGNPRKYFGDRTIQEKRLMQEVE